MTAVGAVPWPVAANCSILALGGWSAVGGEWVWGASRSHLCCPSLLRLLLPLFLLLLPFLLRDQHSNRSGRRRASFLHAAMSFRPLLVSLSVWASPGKRSALDPTFDFGSFGVVCLASQ